MKSEHTWAPFMEKSRSLSLQS